MCTELLISRLGGMKGIQPVKIRGDGGDGQWLVRMEWCPAGLSVSLPLLTLLSTIKSRSSLLAPAHPDGPGKRAVKRLWCGGDGSPDGVAPTQIVGVYASCYPL